MARREVSNNDPWVEQDVEHESSSGPTCPEYQHSLTTTDGETVCDECGLVVAEDRLDRGPEWPYEASQRERTGAPLTLSRHDRGLSTEIGHGADAAGNALSGRKRRQRGQLRREHNRGRWRTKAERNLAHGLTDIRRITSAMDLPESIQEQACALFRSAQDASLLPGRSIEAVAAVSVYAACRCNGLARTRGEVEHYARCDRSGVKTAYKTLTVELALPTPPQRPADFVPRFASDLGVSDCVRRRALKLARAAADLTAGCQPTGVAAACLYVAAREHGERVTQVEVAEVADTSTMTVRAHRDTLREHFG